MSNEIFPTMPGLAWNVTRQPEFHTKIQKSISGREVRLAFTSNPMYSFKLSYEVLREDAKYSELRTLCGFFLARMGSFDSFLFSDPGDNSVKGQNLGFGDGYRTSFQLVRAYGPSNSGFVEAVYYPSTDLIDPGVDNVLDISNILAAPSIVPHTWPVVYVNDVQMFQGIDYTIGNNGVIEFSVPPSAGSVIKWDGKYFYRVRFNQDAAEFNQFLGNLWELKKCELYGSLIDKI
jgi:hypothetical protein